MTLAYADSDAAAPAEVEVDPELLDLLTRREPTEEDAEAPDKGPAMSRCHPERPDSPRERSLCICEEACTRTIDRQRIARRMLESGGDPETIQRWLDEGRGSTLHYPYSEIDGTRIEFDGDGVVTRCRHFFGGVRDSGVDIQCAELPRTAVEPAT